MVSSLVRLDAIGALCGSGKKRGLLIFAVMRGDLLEGVPARRVAKAPAVDGKVGFEQASCRPDRVDAKADVLAPPRDHLVRAGRAFPLRPAHAEQAVHADPADLDEYIRTGGDIEQA